MAQAPCGDPPATAREFFANRFSSAGWVWVALLGVATVVVALVQNGDLRTGFEIGAGVLFLVILGTLLAALHAASKAVEPPRPKVRHADTGQHEYAEAKVVLTLDSNRGWQHGDEVDVVLIEKKHERWLGAGRVERVTNDGGPVVVVDQTNPDLAGIVGKLHERLDDLSVIPTGSFSRAPGQTYEVVND